VWIVVKISVFFTELHSGRCEDAWGGGDWGERVFCIDKSHVLVGDHVLVFFVAFVLGLASVRGMSIGLLPTMPVPDLGL
jgi:hypothetical protein